MDLESGLPGLNEENVNRGCAAAEWCGYKPAVTERRVNPSVGSVTRQGEVGRAIAIGGSSLSSGHYVAI